MGILLCSTQKVPKIEKHFSSTQWCIIDCRSFCCCSIEVWWDCSGQVSWHLGGEMVVRFRSRVLVVRWLSGSGQLSWRHVWSISGPRVLLKGCWTGFWIVSKSRVTCCGKRNGCGWWHDWHWVFMSRIFWETWVHFKSGLFCLLKIYFFLSTSSSQQL